MLRPLAAAAALAALLAPAPGRAGEGPPLRYLLTLDLPEAGAPGAGPPAEAAAVAEAPPPPAPAEAAPPAAAPDLGVGPESRAGRAAAEAGLEADARLGRLEQAGRRTQVAGVFAVAVGGGVLATAGLGSVACALARGAANPEAGSCSPKQSVLLAGSTLVLTGFVALLAGTGLRGSAERDRAAARAAAPEAWPPAARPGPPAATEKAPAAAPDLTAPAAPAASGPASPIVPSAAERSLLERAEHGRRTRARGTGLIGVGAAVAALGLLSAPLCATSSGSERSSGWAGCGAAGLGILGGSALALTGLVVMGRGDGERREAEAAWRESHGGEAQPRP